MSKLLIVDDSEVLLEVMKSSLEDIGHTVKTLLRADDIYNEISDFQPDLLILDIVLDNEDGRQICKELKTNIKTKDLWVVLFSSYHKLLEDYKNYDADDFMIKPFELDMLLEKIKSVLPVGKTQSLKDIEHLTREIISKACPLHGKHATAKINKTGHLVITACCNEFHRQIINIVNFMNR